MPLIDNNHNINNNNNNNNNSHHQHHYSTSFSNDHENLECLQVTLTRSPLHGFGIAISGGTTDNSKSTDFNRFAPDENLVVCEVIKNGPADGKLLPNDQIINVNGHPVIRTMEHSALKLIRESTDFVNLVVRRRKHPVIVSDSQPPMKFILSKTRKEEKFGIVLGCRYFIKKVHYPANSDAFANLHEGDEVIKINETPVDRLTLPEAQKLIDKAKERLVLFVLPSQSRNEKSLSSQIENGAHPVVVHNRSSSSRKELQSDYNQHVFERSTPLLRSSSGTRYVSFFTDTSSMGIRLAGGDKHGLFICEVQPSSVAQKAGLLVADKIFSVNNVDFATLTREEAVLCLMNMKTSQVNMIVANLRHEYEQLLADVGGDSFYIRAHFTYNTSNEEELPIRVNDIFHVTDTLYNGQVGYWVATKLNGSSGLTKVTGAIPNKLRAEQIASVAPSLDQLIKSKQPSFKRKLRSKFSDKRSRSVSSLHQLKEESLFAKVPSWKPLNNSKFPAYERVVLKAVTMVRPVVLFGPLADIARDRLLKEYPERFEIPRVETHSPTKSRANVIKLQSIKNVIQRNRHCLLDVTPTAVEQLNYAQCSPIVIFLKATDRRQIKQLRQDYGKLYQKSSRRLFDSSERLEFLYSYLFTSTVKLDGGSNWYKTLKAQIELQQEQPVWMSDDRPADKDLPNSEEYFISTRHSYSDDHGTRDESSPDSDRVALGHRKGKSYLQRVASDPVVFPKDKSGRERDIPRTFDDDDEEEEEEDDDDDEEIEEDDDHSGFVQHSTMSLPSRSHSVIEIPTVHSDRRSSAALAHSNSSANNSLLYQRSMAHLKTISDSKDPTASVHRRSYQSTSTDHHVYRPESLSQLERDDLYRLQHLYHYDEQEKYQTNRFENELLSNTARLHSAHPSNGSLPTSKASRGPSRRPLIAPKLRAMSINDRLSSSDSGGSVQHHLRKDSTDKSTMTQAERNVPTNGYATWNRPISSSSSTRATILPSYSNGFEQTVDPLYRILRCTSMDAVRRNEQLAASNPRDEGPFREENVSKPKVSSNKKQYAIPTNVSVPVENPRSQSFSNNAVHRYGEVPLQKPRVYTQDDRTFAPQHQILSSSSTSSTLSVKDKSIKEGPQKRSTTVQENLSVIGGARGVMDYFGGKLSCPSTGVSIFVPVGAIPEGVQQEIYFQVCQDSSSMPTLNTENRVSPIVMCGPHGLQFLKPVELILPHSAGSDAPRLDLKLHGADPNGSVSNYSLDKSSLSNGIHHVTTSNVSIVVDHF